MCFFILIDWLAYCSLKRSSVWQFISPVFKTLKSDLKSHLFSLFWLTAKFSSSKGRWCLACSSINNCKRKKNDLFQLLMKTSVDFLLRYKHNSFKIIMSPLTVLILQTSCMAINVCNNNIFSSWHSLWSVLFSHVSHHL